jgi:phosphatidylglycerol:prolipoprotein diacylglycerol transferase
MADDKKDNLQMLSAKSLFDFLLHAFFGLIIGARLGYVLFYDLSYFFHNPLAIISPFDPATGSFVGFYGMSYHGGLIGVIIVGIIFTRKHHIGFLRLANFVVPAVPAGYFFGRVGNFLNGELYGRTTQKIWGMYFSTDYQRALRHPSQLYEALGEGLAIFLILWAIRNNPKARPHLLVIYLFLYAATRFLVEFFRQPDPQVGLIALYFTLGQLLSVFMLILAGFIFWRNRKNGV